MSGRTPAAAAPNRQVTAALKAPEDKNTDPVRSPDPMLLFEDMARRAGLLEAHESLTTELLAFATLIVDRCAAIADGYGEPDGGGNAGEHIRSELYEH